MNAHIWLSGTMSEDSFDIDLGEAPGEAKKFSPEETRVPGEKHRTSDREYTDSGGGIHIRKTDNKEAIEGKSRKIEFDDGSNFDRDDFRFLDVGFRVHKGDARGEQYKHNLAETLGELEFGKSDESEEEIVLELEKWPGGISRRLRETGMRDGIAEIQLRENVRAIQVKVVEKALSGEDFDERDAAELAMVAKFYGDRAIVVNRRMEFFGQDKLLDMTAKLEPGGPLFGNLDLIDSAVAMKVKGKAEKSRQVQIIAHLNEGFDADEYFGIAQTIGMADLDPVNIMNLLNGEQGKAARKDLAVDFDRLYRNQLAFDLANDKVAREYIRSGDVARESDVIRMDNLINLALVNEEKGRLKRDLIKSGFGKIVRGIKDKARSGMDKFDEFVAGVSGEDLKGYSDERRERAKKRAAAGKMDIYKERQEEYQRRIDQKLLDALDDPAKRREYVKYLRAINQDRLKVDTPEFRMMQRAKKDENVRNTEMARMRNEVIKLDKEAREKERKEALKAERDKAIKEFKEVVTKKAENVKNAAFGLLGDVCQMYLWGFIYGATNGLIGHEQVFGAVDWMVDNREEIVNKIKGVPGKVKSWWDRMFNVDEDTQAADGFKSNPRTGSIAGSNYRPIMMPTA